MSADMIAGMLFTALVTLPLLVREWRMNIRSDRAGR